MKHLVILNGKGGTSKTTVATSLALSLAGQMPGCLLGCDVEVPNACLFLGPEFDRRAEAELPVLLHVPLNRGIAEGLARGIPLVELAL